MVRLIIGPMSALLVFSIASCNHESRHGLNSDTLKGVPRSVSVSEPSARSIVPLGELRLGVPQGCRTCEQLSDWATSDPRVDLICKDSDERVGLKFESGPSLTSAPHPEWLIAPLRQHMDDPSEWLSSFPTDFEFMKSVYKTQPSDLGLESGIFGCRVAALLEAKRRLLWPVKQVNAPGITAFFKHVESARYGFVVARVLDKKGTVRGTLTMRCSKGIASDKAEGLLVKFLSGSSFREQ